jgi:molybdopterin molybdotransferase
VSALEVRSGCTVRVFTGAPLPRGAGAVVPWELTQTRAGVVTFTAPGVAGKNIRRAGDDMKPGDRPLAAGHVLHSTRLALAAALGHARLTVSRVPRVAVLSPGDELVPAAEVPGPGKIRNSNAHYLAGALRETGAEPLDLGIVGDDPRATEAAIAAALERGADAVVTSGGASAGDYDFVREFARERAQPAWVFKVAMRPGKPLVFGLIAGRPLFGLPGNPASAIVAFEVFVRPALRKMRGEAQVLPAMFGARFPFEYRYPTGRTFFLRARIEADDGGGYHVLPPGPQDSSFLRPMAGANALVVLDPDRGLVQAGDLRPAQWLAAGVES